jgi:HlyD family secretion protein
VSGLIFDLEAYPGYVPPAGQAAQPILKIVPEDSLIAEVYIRPEDIGFVREDMATDVRITAFPFGEFGDVKGRVSFIGKDALEPEPPYDFFRYPAKVELDQQFINIRGEDKILQSGMGVQANIRVRENRTVLMLLFDKFFVGLDKFKQVR